MTTMSTSTYESGVDAPDGPREHRWTFNEYAQASEAGVFGDRRVELINGKIIDTAAQRNDHWISVAKTARLLFAHFPLPYAQTSHGERTWFRG